MTSSKLLKGIGAAFIGFRWLFTLLALAVVVRLFTGPSSITGTLLLPSSQLPTASAASDGGTVPVHALKATVQVPVEKESASELRTLARLAIFPEMLALAIGGIAVCELGRRLTRNFERGELFSARNANLVRWITVALIAATIVSRSFAQWACHLFGRYAATHLTIGGAHPLPTAEHVIAELSVSTGNADLIVLLLLLLVFVAFRQGVALKQENDLTV